VRVRSVAAASPGGDDRAATTPWLRTGKNTSSFSVLHLPSSTILPSLSLSLSASASSLSVHLWPSVNSLAELFHVILPNGWVARLESHQLFLEGGSKGRVLGKDGEVRGVGGT
jgi:hypothetical protein